MLRLLASKQTRQARIAPAAVWQSVLQVQSEPEMLKVLNPAQMLQPAGPGPVSMQFSCCMHNRALSNLLG